MGSFTHLFGVMALLLCGVIAADAPGPTMPNIAPNCNKWYVAQIGDTCQSAQNAGKISKVKFLEWNPDVSKDCTQGFQATYAYCIGIDTTMSITSRTSSAMLSTSTRLATSVTTATVNATYSIRNPITTWNITTPTIGNDVPPKETQAGQPDYCIDWHLVSTGHTCQSIVNQYSGSLTMDDLLDWNPVLQNDCSGLIIGFWVCIRIQPRSSLTLTFGGDSTSVSIPDSTPYTTPTLPTVDTSFTPTPTQGTLPRGCQAYYQASSNERCDDILAQYTMITREQFFTWNSFLDGNCDGLWAGYYYCVWVGTPKNRPNPPVMTTRPYPVPSGTASNCVAWYEADGGDDCDMIVAIFGRFSKDDFISWNPIVQSDCSGIQDKTNYCVAVPGTPTTRTAEIPSTTPIANPPTQSGIAQQCVSLWTVSSLDSCESIARANGISLEDFYRWNPAVGTSSCDHLLPDYDVCVDGGGTSTVPTISASGSSVPVASSSSTIASKPSSTTTTPAGSTPTPIQSGMIEGCRRFYLTHSGDGCYAISSSAKINLSDFYKWNPGVGSSCLTMQADVYVCIGLSGPSTTISSGPPVPT